MKVTKWIITVTAFIATLSFTGCAPVAIVPAPGGPAYGDAFYYEGYNYGYNRNESYRIGVRHGCSSKRGTWKRNNYRYNHDYSYRAGWNAGYNQCRKVHTGNYYNMGYNDGCWTKRYRGIRKNQALYDNNRKYRRGWNNGFRECRRRY